MHVRDLINNIDKYDVGLFDCEQIETVILGLKEFLDQEFNEGKMTATVHCDLDNWLDYVIVQLKNYWVTKQGTLVEK